MSVGFSFGEIPAIEIKKGVSAFILVVTFVVIFEIIMNTIDYLRDYYPSTYQAMQKLNKELMIMGTISFSILMIESLLDLEQHKDWVVAIDHAHILLFFSAIFLVLHAGALIFDSMRLGTLYARFHNTLITTAIENIQKARKIFCLSKYVALPLVSKCAEFKVQHNIFREGYGLPLKFDFSNYVTKCYEAYVLKLLDISPINWVAVMIMSGFTFIVIEYFGVKDKPCLAGDHEVFESYGQVCYYKLTAGFIGCGVLLFVWFLGLFIFVRHCERKYVFLPNILI